MAIPGVNYEVAEEPRFEYQVGGRGYGKAASQQEHMTEMLLASMRAGRPITIRPVGVVIDVEAK